MPRQVSPPSSVSSSDTVMDKYEQLSVVGEGSYGVVLKCKRRDTGQIVAIKKFLETEDDAGVRKMALREIRMLKKLRHDHLVNMIEVFRRKRRFYLVFEYLEHTLLDQLEAAQGGLGEDTSKKHLFQLLKGIEYCHQNSIIHRDVKPENVLVSSNGIVKLCDLGFARTLAAPGEPYTEYVATRWYRAPELLVAEHRYGPEVDIWAIGCLFAEMLTGNALFPGDSDIDQLALIIKIVGKLAPRHQQVMSRLSGGGAVAGAGRGGLPGTGHSRDLLASCLRTEPRARPQASQLLKHKYFTHDGFPERFGEELRQMFGREIVSSPQQATTARTPAKPRQQWTLNIIQDQNKKVPDTTSDSLINYDFTTNSAISSSSAGRKANHDDKSVGGGLPPAVKPPQPASLARAINQTFHTTFPVPLMSYQHTSYIKRANNKIVMDEDLLRGRSIKKNVKKASPGVTLPYVPGASNSPMKKAKRKQVNTSKSHDHETTHGGMKSKSPTTLPYM